jgi:hypothetical protein
MADFPVQKKSHTWLWIFLLIIIIICLASILYFTVKKTDFKNNETNSTIPTKDIIIQTLDINGNEIEANYELSLNGLPLAEGKTKTGVVETYKNIIVNMTYLECDKDAIQNRLNNGTNVCMEKVSIKEICKRLKVNYEEGQCYVEAENVSACPNNIQSYNPARKRCYLNSLCNGFMQGTDCSEIVPPKSQTILYLKAFSDDYYWGETICYWNFDKCAITLEKKPELNITIINSTLILDNLNNGTLRPMKLCVAWDFNMILFNISDAERFAVPNDLMMNYDKCYLLNGRASYNLDIIQKSFVKMDFLLMGEFVHNETFIKKTLYSS